MTWIKDRKFLIGLTAGTLLLVAVSLWFGMNGSARYEQAKAAYQSAADDASNFEKLALYPTKENFDSKKLALDEYRKSAQELQDAFAAHRAPSLPPVSPQDLSDQMRSAADETRKAFGQKTSFPEGYYCGFEAYRNKVSRGDAAGILSYQLGHVKQLMLDLAAAGPSKLIGIHRPELAEESGKKHEAAKEDVSRFLPIEITFQGTEKAVRQFISSIADDGKRYVVVRSIKIKNAKQDPPRSTDAIFDRAGPLPSSSGANPGSKEADIASLFAAETPAAPGQAATAAAPAAPADTGRILSQVLGNEELIVFLRLDLVQFFPAKELP